MRVAIILAVAAVVMGVSAQGGTCFDDFDCVLKGGKCNKKAGGITGTCSSGSGSTTTKAAGGIGLPTGLPGVGGGSGGTCFDDFDCILKGGKCNKKAGGIVGSCSSGSATTKASGGFPAFPTGFKRIVKKEDHNDA